MATHVALLRGINVGRAKRIAMAELRTLLEGLGHTDVATVLVSGNVVFSSRSGDDAATAAAIERAIAERFGMDVKVFVRSVDALRAIVTANPLAALVTDPSRMQITIADAAPDPEALRPVLASPWGDEAVALGAGALYAWLPDGITGSPLAEALARSPGGTVGTTRNLATLTKVLAKAGA